MIVHEIIDIKLDDAWYNIDTPDSMPRKHVKSALKLCSHCFLFVIVLADIWDLHRRDNLTIKSSLF